MSRGRIGLVLAALGAAGVVAIGLGFAGAPAASDDGAHGSAQSPRANHFYGRVNRVLDGDSLRFVTTDGRTIEVRLAEIDTPEKGEPYSEAARRRLQQLALDREVAIEYFDSDTYGRLVGRVYVGETWVNAELVRAGLAVVYRRFVEDLSLCALEAEAREAGRGLWSQARRPRGYGDGGAPCSAGREGRASPGDAGPFRCAGKTRCRQMRSCAEARFYLEQCGVTTIDGDGDGIPCERLCQ